MAGDGLPLPVAEMRDQLLAAVRSGHIEDLKPALDWNELPPTVAREAVDDPIAHWKAQSADGSGKAVLDALAALLDGPPAVLPLGRDLENNRLYVWPRFAERPPAALDAGEQTDLARLASPAEVQAMREAGRYTGWRLVIGADGTWHALTRGE